MESNYNQFKTKNGVPGRTRTLSLLIRSQSLYPIELRAQNIYYLILRILNLDTLLTFYYLLLAMEVLLIYSPHEILYIVLTYLSRVIYFLSLSSRFSKILCSLTPGK